MSISKVAVLGASGRAGSEIVKELVRRSISVVAIARTVDHIDTKDLPNVKAYAGDVSVDAKKVTEEITGVDAVVSALHHDVPAATILQLLRDANVNRLLVVGGTAALRSQPGGPRIVDNPNFNPRFKKQATEAVTFLEGLEGEKKIDWSFLSPAANFFVGPRTGKFRVGGEVALHDENGESSISFADYAIAVVDELQHNKHPFQLFSVAY